MSDHPCYPLTSPKRKYRKHLFPYAFILCLIAIVGHIGVAEAALPAAPTNLYAGAGPVTQYNQIILSWTNNATETVIFSIERDTLNDGVFRAIGQVGSNAAGTVRYYDNLLADGREYTYRVRANSPSGFSAYSNTASAVTRTAYPINAPSNLTASVLSPAQVVLSWTDNSNNEADFQIEEATFPTDSFYLVGFASANGTSFTLSGLTQGAWYYYRVRAENYNKYSGYTGVIAVNIRTIAAGAGPEGSISPTSPSGWIAVNSGDNQMFTITPSSGYRISAVYVDGVSVGAVSNYTFYNITSQHSIAAFFVENTPPTGTIKINNGEAYTNTTSVTLALSATDPSGVAEMQFSNDATAWSKPEQFAVTKAWTLSSGDGTKNVYVRYKDGNGNWSSPNAINAAIILDSTPPIGTIKINNDAAYTNTTSVTLTLSSTDPRGVTEMQFSNDALTWSGPQPYTGTRTWNLLSGDSTMVTLPTATITHIAAGMNYIVASMSDGTLWSWGYNGNGQLGDGTKINKSRPVRLGMDGKWVSIAAGAEHTVAVRSDGTLWGWGFGQYIGVSSTRPVQIGTDNKWISVAAGQMHTVAVKSDGTLWAWGYNTYGQIGDGTTVNKYSPVKIGTDNMWVSAAAGAYHTVALKSDGTLWAWGYNSYGQLGDGTTVNKISPVQIGTDNKWKSVAAGFNHNIALKSDGTLWAWGWNYTGQLGDGTSVNKTIPIQIGTDNKWVSITAGYFHTIALKLDGTLWAWGENGSGRLGDGTTVNKYNPVQIGTDNTWVSAAAGYHHTVAMKSNGTLWTWGENAYGQLGDGTLINKKVPETVMFPMITQVTGGRYFTAAVKSDGALWVWGYNAYGQLGDGTTVNKYSPAQIGTDKNWISLSGKHVHTVALKADGTLWAWGYNAYGQLGDGTLVNKTTPIQIGTDNKWATIAAGANHTLALKSDGTLWAWGYNFQGQLGDGTTVNKTTPVQIGTDNKWVSITAGQYHTVALKSDGTLWAWGNNVSGQLGDGTTVDKASPIQIGTDNKWALIAAGWNHNIAVKSDGTLWAWGWNSSGQLGDGTTVNKTSPVQIGAYNNWVSITAGWNHSIALKSDGTLWAWGDNVYGELGDGTVTQRTTPVQTGTGSTWVSIAAGFDHTVAQKSDGTLWTWGNNNYGQLGDGTTKTVYVRYKDSVGNWSSPTAISASIILDMIPPAISVAPVTTPTNQKTQTITGTRESNIPVTVTVSTAASVGPVSYPTSTSWSCTLSVMLEGVNSITAKSVDSAGNIGAATASITVDTIKPTISISPVKTPTNLNSQTITGTQDLNAAVTITVNTAASVGPVSYPTTTSWSCTLSSMPDGLNTITVKATDPAGNFSTATAAITVDTIKPAVSIAPVITPTYKNYQTITGTRESYFPVTISISTTASVSPVTYPTSTTWSCTLSLLPEGVNIITATTAADAAGNVGSATTSITSLAAYKSLLPSINVSSNSINIEASESATIFFTLNTAATVTIKIIPEKQGPKGSPIYQASQVSPGAGAYFFTWDGHDSAGKAVPDEAYLYILEASDGVNTAIYDPAAPTGTGTISCSQGASYDPYRNEPLSINYSVSQPARVDLSVNSSASIAKVMASVPHAQGSYIFDWNGRSLDGVIVAGGGVVQCAVASLLRENIIITSGYAPKVTMLITDPYVVQLSYGEVTRITYMLSRDANVTVRVLPTTGSGITLLDGEPQKAGEHKIQWDGIDVSDTSGKKLFATQEGDYTVVIQATDSGASSVTRGCLRILR